MMTVRLRGNPVELSDEILMIFRIVTMNHTSPKTAVQYFETFVFLVVNFRQRDYLRHRGA